MSNSVNFCRLTATAQIPTRATPGSAGWDIYADEEVVIPPQGGRASVSTGFSMSMPAGLEAQIRPRSGLALRLGVTVLNAPGTIDSDFRGEVRVLLINHSFTQIKFSRGDRIAQMVFAHVADVKPIETVQLSETERGSGGFGSTGV